MHGYERKEFISDILDSVALEYSYAVVHHGDFVFDDGRDIDLAIACKPRELRVLMKQISLRHNSKITNFFKIDTSVYRVDLLKRSIDNKFIFVELDIITTNSKQLPYEMDSNKILKDIRQVDVDGYKINRVSADIEYDYYITKKSTKKEPIEQYLPYLLELKPTATRSEVLKQYAKHQSSQSKRKTTFSNIRRFISIAFSRVTDKPSISVAILGPDGSGKSTVIDELTKIKALGNTKLFHLKPLILRQKSAPNTDPHQNTNYSRSISHLKVLYFALLYNFGWLLNVFPLTLKYSFIIFDRYYEDIIIDPRRFRYGGTVFMINAVRRIIPKPNFYFVLTTDAKVIHDRKKELSMHELERQIEGYKGLVDNNRIYHIDASCEPTVIASKIIRKISSFKHDQV
jgi:thymidylate kinase